VVGQPTPEEMTPAQAIEHGLCPFCIGHGWLFNIILGETAPCSACVGVGTADAMWEHAAEYYGAPSEEIAPDDPTSPFEGC